MREHTLVIFTAVLTAAAGFPQTDQWRLRMDEGATAEIVGDYAKSVASYRVAAQIAEGFDRGDKRRVTTWNALANMYDALGQSPMPGTYRRASRRRRNPPESQYEYALYLGTLGRCTWKPVNRGGRETVAPVLAIYPRPTPGPTAPATAGMPG
jgi:hypothetical protein